MNKKSILLALLFLGFQAQVFSLDLNARRYYQSGKSAYHDGAYNLAINYFNKSLEQEDNGEFSDDSLYYIALSYYQSRKYKSAIQFFKRLANLFPDSLYIPKSTFLIGNSYYNLKQFDQAIHTLRNLIQSKPDVRLLQKAHYTVAFALLLSNRFGAAADEFKLIMQTFPDTEVASEALLRLGQASLYDNDPKKAIEYLTKFIKKYPKSSFVNEAGFFLGKSYYLEKSPEKALEQLKPLTRIKGFSYQVDSVYTAALCYIDLSRYSDAMGYLTIITRMKSKNRYKEEALYKLGLLYKLKKNYKESGKAFEKIIKSFPKSRYVQKSYIEMASSLILQEKFDQALQIYNKIKSFGGENQAVALSKIGELYFLMKDYKQAIPVFEQLQKQYPDTDYATRALYWKARALLENAQYQDSITDFERYLRQNPLSDKADEINLFIGNNYVGLKDYDAALVAFQKVVNNYKTGRFADDALNAIGWVYVAKGETIRGAEYYGRLIKEYPDSPLIPLAYYSIGILRYNLKDYNAALETFRKVTNHKDSDYFAPAILKTGWIYFKQERFDILFKYLSKYQSEIKNPNQKGELYQLMGWAKFRLKSYSEAIKYYTMSTKAFQNPTKQLESQLYIAKSHYNSGEYNKAIISYTTYISNAKNLKLSTDIPAAISDMAWCYLKTGETQKAEAEFKTLVLEFPNSTFTVEALFKLAEYHYNRAEYLKAIELYDEIRTKFPQHELAESSEYWKAWSYLNLGKKIQAVETFESYITLYPTGDYASDAVTRAANIYYDLNNLPKAKKFYSLLIKNYPKSPDSERAKVLLSEIELKEQSNYDPEKLYLKLIHQSENENAKAVARFKLSDVYVQNGKTEKALVLWQKIIDTTTGDEAAKSVYQLAQVDIDNQNYVEAIRKLGNIFYVYKYEPLYPESLYWLSFSYNKNKNTAVAKKYLTRLIKKYPDNKWSKKGKELLNQIQ